MLGFCKTVLKRLAILICFKTVFSLVCWSRRDFSFCHFITAEEFFRTKWKVSNGVMLNFHFFKVPD